MNKYKRLFRNTALYFVGNLGCKILSFLMVRFYTEIFTKSEYGIVDLIVTTAGFVVPVMTLGINEAVFRFAMDDDKNRRNVLNQGIIMALLGNFLLAGALLLFDFGTDIAAYKYLLLLFCFTDSVYIIICNYCRGIEKTGLYASLGIVNSLTQLVFVVVFLAIFRLGIGGYFYAFSLANVVTITVALIALRSDIKLSLKPKRELLKNMLVYSIPLIANTCCWWVLASMDKYVIAWQLGEEANGIFAAASKLPTLLTMISSIFFQAWQLSSVEEAKSEDKQKFYSEMHDFIYIGLALASSGLMLIIKPLYTLLVGTGSAEGWVYTPFLIMAMNFSALASFFGTNYIAMKKTNGALYTSLVAAVINTILNIVFTAWFGISGTAFATMISYAVLWLIRTIDTRKFVQIKTKVFKMAMTYILLITQAALVAVGVASLWVHLLIFIALVLIHFKDAIHIAREFLSGLKR